jgi:uncharacterized small protein (DUF1192 family)
VLGVEVQPILIALAGGVGAVLVALIGWFATRRTTSGTVATSDAATLWNVAKQLIDDLKAEVERLRAELGVARDRERELQSRLDALESEVARLRRDVNGAI